MLNYFQEETFSFSIDNILYRSHGVFRACIIPDHQWSSFLPRHLPQINVRADLLEEKFYDSITRGFSGLKKPDRFLGSVIQGGYYIAEKSKLIGQKAFDNKTIVGLDNDFFADFLQQKSPYDEAAIKSENTLTSEDGFVSLSKNENHSKKNQGSVYLYCFYCGQGDSFLLITSNGNVYLIDANLCNDAEVDSYIRTIQKILHYHGLEKRRVKGLIITHKHLDHMRCLDQVLNKDVLHIETLLINLEYLHPTKCVKDFLVTSKEKIGRWVNVNRPGVIFEKDTTLCIKNPDNVTATVSGAPDINDSSIVLCIRFGDNLLYLTGDAHAMTLGQKLSCGCIACQSQSLLKVSHHGSTTGTDDSLLNMLSPQYAYISAGNSRKYRHPDEGTMDLLSAQQPTIISTVSKHDKRTVCYKMNGWAIHKTTFF